MVKIIEVDLQNFITEEVVPSKLFQQNLSQTVKLALENPKNIKLEVEPIISENLQKGLMITFTKLVNALENNDKKVLKNILYRENKNSIKLFSKLCDIPLRFLNTQQAINNFIDNLY